MAVVSVIHIGSDLYGESLISRLVLKCLKVRAQGKIFSFVISDDVIVLQNFCPKFISVILPGQKISLVKIPRKIKSDLKILSALLGLFIASGVVDDSKIVLSLQTKISIDLVKRDLCATDMSFVIRKNNIYLDFTSSQRILSLCASGIVNLKYLVMGQMSSDLTIVNSAMNRAVLAELECNYRIKGEKIRVKTIPRYQPNYVTGVVLETKDVKTKGSFVLSSLIPSFECPVMCLAVLN